jgi:hypothetical protein
MSGTDGNTRKDGISFLDKDELVKKMNIILSQTNYTEDEARLKLQTLQLNLLTKKFISKLEPH